MTELLEELAKAIAARVAADAIASLVRRLFGTRFPPQAGDAYPCLVIG